jgi:ribosomal protein S18 acetylase RimI-like enzyme
MAGRRIYLEFIETRTRGILDFYEEYAPVTSNTICVIEDAGKNFFIVALDDRDNVVGCGQLRQVESKIGQIRRLWVNPVLRGRSIGRRLLSALEGAGAVAGFDVIRLEVYEALTEAILLFETSGYTNVDPFEESPPDLRAYQKQLVAVTIDV